MKKIRKEIKKRKNRIFNSIMFAIIFMLIPVAINELRDVYIENQPTDNWYRYESVEVVTSTAIAGEYPHFVSYASIYLPITLHWNDVLRCTSSNGEYFYRSYRSSFTYHRATKLPLIKDNKTSTWQYGYRLPDTPGELCYLVSNINGSVGVKINQKKQKVISEPFIIKK